MNAIFHPALISVCITVCALAGCSPKVAYQPAIPLVRVMQPGDTIRYWGTDWKKKFTLPVRTSGFVGFTYGVTLHGDTYEHLLILDSVSRGSLFWTRITDWDSTETNSTRWYGVTDDEGGMFDGWHYLRDRDSVLLHDDHEFNWFLTEDLRSRKPGEQWESSREETVVDEHMLTIEETIRHFTYACDGIVDTLGEQTIRFSWSGKEELLSRVGTDEMYLVRVWDTWEHGVVYYSLRTGLVLARSSDERVDMKTDHISFSQYSRTWLDYDIWCNQSVYSRSE